MSKTISKLKQNKYLVGILIIVIVLGLIGLFSYGKVDKYKGLVKVNKVKLLSSVVNTTNVISKGTEEISYNLTYTLDEVSGITKRDVIIKGKLNSPYARFKEIRKNNITSTLINDGKEIEINIREVDLGVEQNLEIKIQVLNAPNNENIIPEISIKEATGEYTRVTGSPIKVETNSVEGQVIDNNNLPVSNIELSISKEEREIKRTYTDENGKYVFSDLTPGNYIIKVEEEIYEIISGSETSESNPNNLIKVKEVDKFNIETKKYIEKLDLVINGKEEHYTYKDAEKVIQNVKNAKTISGQIEYKIVVRNKGEKKTEIEEVEDTPGEGLEFKESENEGWKNKNGKIVYELMEGVSLNIGEKREVKLVLSINDTNEIKTYINKLTSKGEIKEKVVFVIDGEIKRELEVTEGTVIERPDFHIDDLDGWYTDKNYTNKYKFTNRVNKDLILYARTNEEKTKYTVRYIDKNEVIKEELVEEGNKTTAPSNPSKTGYTFNCWKKNDSCFDFNTEIHENIDLVSSYDIITYHITYNLQEGTVSGNPDTYTVETDTFTLNNPSKEGYTFTGWTGSNGETPSLSVTIEKGSIGDKEYTANYQIDRYQLEIDPKGGSYQGDLLIEEDYGTIVTINNPSKEGYNFTGWTLTGSGTYNNGIYTFGEGNGKLEANYEVINYDIVYKEITDAERDLLSNPTSYTIETTEFTLHNPNNRLNEDNEGEIFVGWKEKNSDTPSISITLPDTSNLGNKEYTAIWQEREADKWNIIYNLNGGEVSGNPSSYKRSELPITLNNPEKTGYTFIGWTGSNGDTPSNVTIPRGTEGDLSYTANYEVNNYGITYDYTSCNLTPEEITTLNNRGSYTIEDNNFNLNNPSKYGYVFEGWTGTDLTSKTINVEVDTSKIKNLSYKANCVLDKYKVEFYNMKSNGEYELSTTVSDIEYNSSIPSNKIPTVSLRGYTFKYWSLDKTTEFNLSTPITEDTVVYAVYQKDIYNITYNLDGGTVSENPESYSVDTEEFTLNNPTKTGYEFTGWTGSCGDSPLKVVTLPEEELGPKNYVANYKINKYTVTYMNGESKVDDEEVEYNKKATGDVETPTKAHNIFKGWTLNNELYDFNTPVTENITLYASWEEVESPLITHSPTTWVGDKVLVTIGNKGTTGKDYTGYTYKYKIGSGSYQDYNGPFEVTENTTIYAYSVKDEINSIEESHEINNIDKINPKINEKTVTGLSPVSVTLNIKGQDLESGLAYIKVYLGSDEVFSTEEYPGNDNNEKEETITIGNLEQITTYTFTIEVIDKVGNTYQEEIEVTTPAKHYVARTLEDDGTEIAKYETLREAIESTECVSICNIEMLDDVEETNVVLDGQDIKLDLNGFTITGLTDKAFENNGTFKIVDYNEDEIGKVFSSGTAIVNTGRLFIGENEEPLVVSKTEPIIEGSVTGVDSPGELYFYDGKIIGASNTGALKGTTPITPYSYNASVDTIEGKEIATLEIIADAEARINSVYYTKVQEAINDSNKGSYVYPEGIADIISQVESTTNYKFTFDENTGKIKNNNQGIANSTAKSYIYISTKNEANDKILSIDASISSQSGYDIGYVILKETRSNPDYNDKEGRLIYLSGTASDNINVLLEKEKEYYLFFGYRKDGSTNTGTDTFTINSIKLSDYVVDSENDMLDNIVSENQYHFKKQDDYYVSTNVGIHNSTSHAYVKIDMTGVDYEKKLYVEALINSDSTDYGYVTVNNSAEMPLYSDTVGREVYVSGISNSRSLYPVKLKPNQINYVHFGYYKNGSYHTGADSFKIYSLRLEDEVIKSGMTSDIVAGNPDYYMVESNVVEYVDRWKDSSGNEKHAKLNGQTLNQTKDGYDFHTKNDFLSLGVINNPQFTWEAEFEVRSFNRDNIIISNQNSGGSIIYIPSGTRVLTAVSHLGGSYKTLTLGEIEINTKYKVVVTYDGTKLEGYLNDEKNPTIITASPLKYGSGSTELTIGNHHLHSSAIDGTIYDIRIYNRGLTENEALNISTVTEGQLVHLNGSDSRVQVPLENNVLINNNQTIPSSVADSYMAFDLTNVLAYKKIIVNAEISSQSGYDFGYVTVTDSTTTPAYNNSSGRYVYISGEVAATDYNVTLTPGRINYVHFCYRKDGSTNTNKDTFIINSIKYYEDSNETIPVYLFSNTSNKKTLSPVIEYNQDADQVQILRNITLTEKLEIEETRNVILDLNGYTLTTSANDSVISNDGSLKIIDSNYSDQVDMAHKKYNQEMSEYNEQLEKYYKYISSATYAVEHDFTYDYDTIDDYQEFVAPYTGTYEIEVWGASGGYSLCSGSKCGTPGQGGYSKGIIELNKGEILYIYVGSKGTNAAYRKNSPASYNGGGLGTWDNNDDEAAGAGGGATDIRLVSGTWNDSASLVSRIMVAGGGGGSSWNTITAGYGGGLSGGNNSANGSLGATQTSGYAFGIGKNGSGTGDSSGVAGGGGGYYGGYSFNTSTGEVGSGGSGYISGHLGSVAIKSSTNISPKEECEDGTTDISCSYHYSGKKFTSTVMKSGNEEITEPDGTTNIGHTGNGFARIKIADEDIIQQAIIDAADEDVDISTRPDTIPEMENDLSHTGNIISTTNNVITNKNNARLELDNVIINMNKSGTSSNWYFALNNCGYLTITGDSFINISGNYIGAIYNNINGEIDEGHAKIVMSNNDRQTGIENNSIVDSDLSDFVINKSSGNDSYGIYHNAPISIELNDVKLSFNSQTAVYNNRNVDMTINDSTIGNGKFALANASTANSIYINNSIINGTIKNNSNLAINNSKLNTGSTYYNINNESTGSFHIKDSYLFNYNDYNSIYSVNRGVIEDSTITCNKVCLYNTGTMDINNTKIITKGLSDLNVIDNRGTMNIDGGSINNDVIPVNSTGVTNTGTLNVNGNFKIRNMKIGINNTGSFTLGDSEDEVNTDYPSIQASTKAVQNSINGTYNYYDGELIGNINNALFGKVDLKPEGYDLNVIKNTSDSIEKVTLKTNIKTSSPSEDDYVAQIGNNKYVTLQEAFNDVPTNDIRTTVTIIKDIETAEAVSINENQNILLDFNDHYIKSYYPSTYVTNNGTLTTIENSDNKRINYSFSPLLIQNNGVLDLNDINISILQNCKVIENNGTINVNMNNLNTSSNDGSFPIFTNNGTATIDNLIFVSNVSGNKGIINNSSIMVINNATFKTNNSASSSGYNFLYNTADGIITVNYSEYTDGGSSTFLYNLGDATVLDGNYSNAYIAYYNNGTLLVKGGTYANSSIRTNYKKLFINAGSGDAEFNGIISYYGAMGDNYGILKLYNVKAKKLLGGWYGGPSSGYTFNAYNSAKTYINNSEFDHSGNVLLRTYSTSETYIDNSRITSTIGGSSYSGNNIMLYDKSYVKIENSTLTSRAQQAISMAGTSTLDLLSGVINNIGGVPAINISSNVTLNIGKLGEGVDITTPEISSPSGIGINSSNKNAIINFYDGIITGKTNKAISANITEIEPEYEIITKTNENDTESKYLAKLPLVKNIDQDKEYFDLQLAINESLDGDTLQMTRDLTILTDTEEYTINSNKNLTIDLNGFNIITGSSLLFKNEGTLNLVDNSEDKKGIISIDTAELIENSGTLTIDVGVVKSEKARTANFIINDGSLTIDNIKMSSTVSSIIGIVNTGDIIINAGTFNISNDNVSSVVLNNKTNSSYAEINGGTFNSVRMGYNYGTMLVNNGVFNNTNIIFHNYNILEIKGGTFGNSSLGTNNYTKLLYNSPDGSINIENTTYWYANIGDNYGTLTFTNFHAKKLLGGWYGGPQSGSTFNNYGSSKTYIYDSEFDQRGNVLLRTYGTSETYLKNSSIISTSIAGYSGNNIMLYDSSYVKIEESTLSSQEEQTINMAGTSTLDFISGTITKYGSNSAINISSNVTLNIGTSGDNMNKTTPEITSPSGYAIYSSNNNAQINFYDGTITAKPSQNIYGVITSIEPGYEVLSEINADSTESKYLGNEKLVEIERTGNKYDTFEDALLDAQENDILKLTRNYNLITSSTTTNIPNTSKIMIDLNGYVICNNSTNVIFSNEGDMTFVDSNIDSKGMIISAYSKAFVNNGKAYMNGGRLYNFNSAPNLIENNGTMEFNGLNFNFYWMNTGGNLIVNNGTMDFNSGKIKTRSTDWYGATNYSLLRNNQNATLTISGGVFEREDEGPTVSNLGTLYITGGDFSKRYENLSTIISNSGQATITGGTYGSSSNVLSVMLISNSGTATIEGITHGTDYLIASNSGTLNLINNTFYKAYRTSYNYAFNNTGTLNVTGGTINTNDCVFNLTGGQATINNLTITSTNDSFRVAGTAKLDLIDSVVTSNNQIIEADNNSVSNIISGTYISNNSAAINLSSNSTVNIGESGGVPSITNPIIIGKTYGVNHPNNTSKFNYYDGVIKGETGSIYGTITEVEDGYKEKRDNVTDPDTGVATIDSTLTVVGDTERIAMVGSVNFLSLQSAVNYASNNNIPDIQMFKSVTLEADLVKPDGGANVIIHLNGTTITEGSYTIGDGITIDTGVDPGANISRFLANISGQEINPRNIVIYEMEDGSSLKANETYKLYKEIDGQQKIVKLKENEIGNYDLGTETDILRTTRSRIYINGIGEGTYKLVGSDSKEIVFTINYDGVSNNIRENNNINGSRVSTAVATLILSLQTGVARNPYILIIMFIIVVILGFIAYQKYKREE